MDEIAADLGRALGKKVEFRNQASILARCAVLCCAMLCYAGIA